MLEGRLIRRIEYWDRRALSLLCGFLLRLKEGFRNGPEPSCPRPSRLLSPRAHLQLELSLPDSPQHPLSGNLISQDLFWKSRRQNDFSFNLLLFLILKLCFVFKKSQILSRYEELRTFTVNGALIVCFGNSLKSLYSLWSICIYTPFFQSHHCGNANL